MLLPLKQSLLFALLLSLCGCDKREAIPLPENRKAPNDDSSRVSITLLARITGMAEGAAGRFDGFTVTRLDSFPALIQNLSSAAEFRDLGEIGPDEKIELVKRFVYEKRGITFDSSQYRIENIVPHLVWNNQRGSCLGVSLIFLMMGEKLNLPFHGVLLPGHFFVRYDDGSRRINLEPNRGGYSYTDSEYRKKYGVTDSSWYDLRNLTVDEVVSVFAYALGNIFLEGGKYDLAIEQYESCLNTIKDFGEAMGNMAIAYAGNDRPDKALELLSRARSLHPPLPDLHKNLGALLSQQDKFKQAIREYQAGLKKSPGDADLLCGLAAAYYHSGSRDRAKQAVQQAQGIDPDNPEVKRLLKVLEEQGKRTD
ncbi:tetratricopeptide repeat protein [Fibrobacterota bacterium]